MPDIAFPVCSCAVVRGIRFFAAEFRGPDILFWNAELIPAVYNYDGIREAFADLGGQSAEMTGRAAIQPETGDQVAIAFLPFIQYPHGCLEKFHTAIRRDFRSDSALCFFGVVIVAVAGIIEHGIESGGAGSTEICPQIVLLRLPAELRQFGGIEHHQPAAGVDRGEDEIFRPHIQRILNQIFCHGFRIARSSFKFFRRFIGERFAMGCADTGISAAGVKPVVIKDPHAGGDIPFHQAVKPCLNFLCKSHRFCLLENVFFVWTG